MAIPPTTPPTIGPTLLVAASEVVGVEVAEVEVAEVVGVEVTEARLVEVATIVDVATVDGKTRVDSGPPERRSVSADQ